MTVARIGVRAQGHYGNIQPYGHIAYATRDGDDLNVSTSLGGLLPGTTPVTGGDQDYIDLGLGVAIDMGPSGRFLAEYRGALSDDYTRNTARLAYEVRF